MKVIAFPDAPNNATANATEGVDSLSASNATMTSDNATASNATKTSDSATASNNTSSEPLTDVKSILVKSEKSMSIRKRRSVEDEEEAEADGVKKMAARGENTEEKKVTGKKDEKREAPAGKSSYP